MTLQSENLRKTPLCELHKNLKAKMVPFGGWLMPVSYSSVLAEHKAVREQCGLFDVSHMGEIFVRGEHAAAFLQRMTINDIGRLKDGAGQYSALLHDHGGMIDDLIIYRLSATEYLVCANAANIDKDFRWLQEHAAGLQGVSVVDESPAWSQLAIQGPSSLKALRPLLDPADTARFDALDYMEIMPLKLYGESAYVARTGYTGEWGYEVYIPNNGAPKLWSALMESQPESGLQPIGLGARDTLRLEACYLLYGNDMDDTVSPLEAGIGWAVRLEAKDFIGKESLIKQKAAGLERQSFAFKMEADGIPRHGMGVYFEGSLIGKVTSGSVLPTVGGAGGLALLDPRHVAVDATVEVDIRGKRKLARVVKKPLYKAKVKG